MGEADRPLWPEGLFPVDKRRAGDQWFDRAVGARTGLPRDVLPPAGT